ncbi:hypothetical protein CEP53_004868 [Fusarium sp. AF-6]|nr:hypothetical protein CEP53_004868 [Fusarium sp. AF-6]
MYVRLCLRNDDTLCLVISLDGAFCSCDGGIHPRMGYFHHVELMSVRDVTVGRSVASWPAALSRLLAV